MSTSPALLFYVHHFSVRPVDIYYLNSGPDGWGERGGEYT